jgi:hypothetical protein
MEMMVALLVAVMTMTSHEWEETLMLILMWFVIRMKFLAGGEKKPDRTKTLPEEVELLMSTEVFPETG